MKTKNVNSINKDNGDQSKHVYLDPKDGDLYLKRIKLEEILVEVRRGTDVQIVCLTWVKGRKTNRTIW